MRIKITIVLLVCFCAMKAQQVVGPNVQIMDRFKPNVPSLVIKANPLTLPFGYIDGGIEYRTQKSGWFAMLHAFSEVATEQPGLPFGGTYTQVIGYLRAEAGHRWYWKSSSLFNGNLEKYLGVSLNSGLTNYNFSESITYDVNGDLVFLSPLERRSRIDLTLAVERGRTRDWAGPEAKFYGETGWKFGYNFGANSPVLLYAIRFNYKAN